MEEQRGMQIRKERFRKIRTGYSG